MNITITATTTQSEESINEFAIAKGYREKIYRTVDILVDGVKVREDTELIDNPQSKSEFVCDFMKNVLTDIMIGPTKEKLARQSESSVTSQINTLKSQVQSTLEINTTTE